MNYSQVVSACGCWWWLCGTGTLQYSVRSSSMPARIDHAHTVIIERRDAPRVTQRPLAGRAATTPLLSSALRHCAVSAVGCWEFDILATSKVISRVFMRLLFFYFLATSVVISRWVLTCDSVIIPLWFVCTA